MDSLKGGPGFYTRPCRVGVITCAVVLDGYHLVVATSGFTQIGIREGGGTSRGATGVTNYSAVCRVAPSVRKMACE